MNRVCVYTKDIQQITGKSERQSRNILNQVKALHHKEKHQLVTIEELSQYLGLTPEEVRAFLK